MDMKGEQIATAMATTVVAATTSGVSTAVSRLSEIEQMLRIGASAVAILSGIVAIVSGCVVVYFTVKKNRRNQP